jgi:hypothetical protein
MCNKDENQLKAVSKSHLSDCETDSVYDVDNKRAWETISEYQNFCQRQSILLQIEVA